MPPKEELFKRFENITVIEVNGEKKVFEWLANERDFWFRPHGATAQLLWFSPSAIERTTFRGSAEEQDGRIERLVTWIWNNKRFYRFVPLREELGVPPGCWAALRLGESGVMLPDRQRCANWRVVFPWTGEREAFLSAPLNVLEFEMERAIHNAPQEWQDVVAWAQMDTEARFWSLVSWKQGNPTEWKMLVQALLQINLRRSSASNVSYYLKAFLLNEPRFAYGSLQVSKTDLSGNISSASWLLLDIAEQHFGARINYSRSRATSTYPAYQRYLNPVIKAEPPTNHELMQALDLWRDFGRRSNQLPSVEELLRELLA